MNFFNQLPLLLVYLGAGTGLGLLYFHGLWWNICQFAGGGRVLTLIFLTLGRFLLLGAALLLISLAGALPLLAATLGILAARATTLRHVRQIAS